MIDTYCSSYSPVVLNVCCLSHRTGVDAGQEEDLTEDEIIGDELLRVASRELLVVCQHIALETPSSAKQVRYNQNTLQFKLLTINFQLTLHLSSGSLCGVSLYFLKLAEIGFIIYMISILGEAWGLIQSWRWIVCV